MASLFAARPALLPQCPSCVRRVTKFGLTGVVQQQTRHKSKAARELERLITVKLLHDFPKYGRAGSYVPMNKSQVRNRWFPMRVVDYVPLDEVKKLKAQGVEIVRDFNFGVAQPLVELEEEDEGFLQQKKHYVRPIELEMLSAERSLELIDTFVPPTIDFARQPIPQEKQEKSQARRHGASEAADILASITIKEKPKANPNAIYGSVSTTDIANTIKGALAHNDEAARVVLTENDITFISGYEEEDTSRVKQLGSFKVKIQLNGAETSLERTVRIRAKE
ncbi:hypothetical protein DM02DRAFT_616790 [Periconia macrospinosa]|uniref:Uncharacterized protein n=1 Tax=Periconia macrospinosa TaxID=97972 RepID=A0A2V1DFU3_9PLEO|nr:hypothetical protein DM02DRAFT_616790 [Periconia macrospinosa]